MASSENSEFDGGQTKANRQQQQKTSHEYCQGYVDKNGIWNNGFYCRRWGTEEDTYCCGNGGEKYCCPEPKQPNQLVPTSSTGGDPPSNSTNDFNYIPLIVGLSIAGLVLLLVVIITSCYFCPGCFRQRRRRTNKFQASRLSTNRTMSVSLEAEAASAVIAAQALVPLNQSYLNLPHPHHHQHPQHQQHLLQHPPNHQHQHQQHQPSPASDMTSTNATPPPFSSASSSSDDGHLHCGCRLSRSTTTMVDIDSIVASMYQNAALPWKPELDNLINYSCEQRPPLRVDSGQMITSGYGQFVSSTDALSSPMTTSSFCQIASNTRTASLGRHHGIEKDSAVPLNQDRTSFHPAFTSVNATGSGCGTGRPLLFSDDRRPSNPLRDPEYLKINNDDFSEENLENIVNCPPLRLTNWPSSEHSIIGINNKQTNSFGKRVQ